MPNTLLDWLFENAVGVKSPAEWCETIGVTIIDADGWRGRNADRGFDEELSLPEFVARLSECTILPKSSPLPQE